MKRLYFIAALLVLGLSSCVYRDDDYDVQPIGYQFSFADEFNDDRNQWSFSDQSNRAYVSIGGGLLRYDYHPAVAGTNTVAVSTGLRTTRDFSVRSRIRSDNAMGMVFGVSPNDYGYSFFIDDQGNYALFDEGTASIAAQAVLSWTPSGAIRSGWNDLELTQSGSTWIGYINDVQVFQVPARSLYGQQVGFMVLANTSGDAEYLEVQW